MLRFADAAGTVLTMVAVALAIAFGATLIWLTVKCAELHPQPYTVEFVTLDENGNEGTQVIDLSPQFVVRGLDGEKWIIAPRTGHARLYDPAPPARQKIPERGRERPRP